jgi:hypothetical protein
MRPRRPLRCLDYAPISARTPPPFNDSQLALASQPTLARVTQASNTSWAGC